MFNNQIRHFDRSTFDKLTQLEYLDVRTKFPADLLHKNRRLQNLLVYSNDLSDFHSEKLVELLPFFDYISFNDNEISYARMVEMVKHLKSKNIYVVTNTVFLAKPDITLNRRYSKITCVIQMHHGVLLITARMKTPLKKSAKPKKSRKSKQIEFN